MSYVHLSITELIFIEEYFNQNMSSRTIAKHLNRSHSCINRVLQKIKQGLLPIEIHLNYKQNKKKCGRKPIVLPQKEREYISGKVSEGWTPDVIIGRNEKPISCSMRTLYRMFDKGIFDKKSLPLQGKRKPNGHQEKRGKQGFKRSIDDRVAEYPEFTDEFGHLEGDTIVGKDHKSSIITLVERKSKFIFAIQPNDKKARDIEESVNQLYNHKIIRAFFEAEDIAGNVTLTMLEGLCSDKEHPELYVPTFRNNYSQMKIDGSKSHGKGAPFPLRQAW